MNFTPPYMGSSRSVLEGCEITFVELPSFSGDLVVVSDVSVLVVGWVPDFPLGLDLADLTGISFFDFSLGVDPFDLLFCRFSLVFGFVLLFTPSTMVLTPHQISETAKPPDATRIVPIRSS